MNDLPELIDGLLDAAAYPHPCEQIELIETHISWVILTGKFAYKLKKPVSLPFIDFSSMQLRHRSCKDEVRLNRRLAPDVYVGVVTVGGSAKRPRIGATPAIEHAVKMVQFSPSQMLNRLVAAGEAPLDGFRDLAARIAQFHAGLDPVSVEAAERTVISSLDALMQVAGADGQGTLQSIAAWLREQSATLEPYLRRREDGGFIRECHGDLHLRNIVRIGGRFVPFDCIEFNKALRCIDTIDEAAFLVMDLMAHGRVDLGFEFLNRYLEISGDYAGVALLRYYLVHRALVRSYVSLLADERDRSVSAMYQGLAAQLIEKHTPVLLITCGLTGSGKTTVTDALIGRLPGIRMRSDVVRKQLHGLEATDRSGSAAGAGLYTRSSSDATYGSLAQFACASLDAGFNAIVDAAFLERHRRNEFASVAQRAKARFVVLVVSADDRSLCERLAQREARGLDASEGNQEILEYQKGYAEPVSEDEPGEIIPVDTTQKVDADRLVGQILA